MELSLRQVLDAVFYAESSKAIASHRLNIPALEIGRGEAPALGKEWRLYWFSQLYYLPTIAGTNERHPWRSGSNNRLPHIGELDH